MKRIVLSTLILLVAAGTVCAQKKASKKKVAKKAKTEAAAPVKIAPDTVNVKDFSYCLGVANSNGLKQYLQQQLRIDTAQYMDDFLRGFKEAANDPTNAKMKAYAAGLQIADQVMNQMLPQANKQITDNRDSAFVNQAEFLRGFLEATTNSGSVTSDSAMKVAERQMEYYHDQLMEKKYGENRIAGEKFLAENAKKDSVVTLPSGLQYKIIKAGTGEKPGENSKVEVNYEGRLIDGTGIQCKWCGARLFRSPQADACRLYMGNIHSTRAGIRCARNTQLTYQAFLYPYLQGRTDLRQGSSAAKDSSHSWKITAKA